VSDQYEQSPDGPTGSISAMPEEVCLTLLGGSVVGRVAFIGERGHQELLPVNYVIIDREIYFRTGERGPLSILADGRDNVAFEVDHLDVHSGQGWNVTVRGETMRVTQPEVLVAIEAAGLKPPWAGGERRLVVKIAIREIDGRRVSMV
jgi:nitroimidazol reductase NimA-like FMN-containing flavoprotein (pyridoxamine 5'-phosphate oxidase superfamily)